MVFVPFRIPNCCQHPLLAKSAAKKWEIFFRGRKKARLKKLNRATQVILHCSIRYMPYSLPRVSHKSKWLFLTVSLRRKDYFVDKQSTTRRQPPKVTAVSLKKGDFNTPSVNPFFNKGNGGFDCYFKTAVLYLWDYTKTTVLSSPMKSFCNRIAPYLL